MYKIDDWVRKYYSAKIEFSEYGWAVDLYGGGRKVTVDSIELEDIENGKFPTLEEVIDEAIKRWDADNTLKKYRIIWTGKPDDPKYKKPECVDKAEFCYNRDYGYMMEVRLQAKNEKEALKMVALGYPETHKVCFSIWEWNS